MNVHPLASAFPEMDADRFAELKADIEKQGVLMPVVTWHKQIIDGRHRARACDELGIECPTKEHRCEESQLPALVWSLNAQRRDLTKGQRALAAAKMANLEWGGHKGGPRTLSHQSGDLKARPVPREEAAKLAGVGTTQVDRGLRVLKSGNPELVQQVERGEKSLYQASIESGERPPRAPKSDDPTEDVRRNRALPAPRHERFARAVQSMDVLCGVIAENATAAATDARRKAFLETLRTCRTTITRAINALEVAA